MAFKKHTYLFLLLLLEILCAFQVHAQEFGGGQYDAGVIEHSIERDRPVEFHTCRDECAHKKRDDNE